MTRHPITISAAVATTVLIFLALVYPQSDPSWVRVISREDVMIYLNTNRISRPSKDVFSVWLKMTPANESKEALKAFKESFRTNGTVSISLTEYRCSTKESRTVAFTDYSSEGKIISTWEDRNFEWKFVVPDSLDDALLQRLCTNNFPQSPPQQESNKAKAVYSSNRKGLRKLVALYDLTDPQENGCSTLHYSGVIVGVKYDAEYSTQVIGITIRTRSGSREYFTVDGDIYNQFRLSRADIGWVASLLARGNRVHATVYACGASGSVQVLHDIRLLN